MCLLVARVCDLFSSSPLLPIMSPSISRLFQCSPLILCLILSGLLTAQVVFLLPAGGGLPQTSLIYIFGFVYMFKYISTDVCSNPCIHVVHEYSDVLFFPGLEYPVQLVIEVVNIVWNEGWFYFFMGGLECCCDDSQLMRYTSLETLNATSSMCGALISGCPEYRMYSTCFTSPVWSHLVLHKPRTFCVCSFHV